jgi:hypothetical protein
MHRRTAATRLVMLITLVALTASFVGTVTVQARDDRSTDRHIRSQTDPGRASAGIRGFRRVDVRNLPAATGKASPYEPNLQRPDGFARAPRAPQGAVPPPPVQSTSNGDPAPTQATEYVGLLNEPKTATDGEPPDPFVAAGPDHVIQVVNTAVMITDRSNDNIVVRDLFDLFGLGEFYPLHDVAYFDPRVIYDSLHARWIVTEASFDCRTAGPPTTGTGYIDIAISDGPDPGVGWSIWSLPYVDELPDYPGLGTSTDKVVVSANVFPLVNGGPMGCDASNSYQGAEMDVMAWSELTGTGDLFYTSTFSNQFFSWRPALQTPATSATVFAVAERFDEDVEYARITGNPAGGAATTVTIANLTNVISGFLGVPQPQQPGPDEISNAVDQRPTDAVWKNNKLAFVSTYPCDAPDGIAEDRDCVRVSELSTATPASPTRIQDFLIAQNAHDLFMGGIGYALNDDLHVAWTRSGTAAGHYPTSYAAYQAADAPNNTISNRAIVAAGTAPYNGNRWGDYVGVAQDPQVPNAVWDGNQYAGGPGFNNWATEITQLQTGGSSYVPIPPVRVLDTRPAFNIGLSGPFTANVPRTFQVSGALGIPAAAVAVTGNVTIANQTAGGYLSVTPTAVANPTSSTINFPLGDTRANNLTVPLSAAGKLAAVYKASAGRTTHLIVDVTGYFLPGDEDSTYSTLTPVRVLDSRVGTGLAGTFKPDIPRTLSIAGANGIPADAKAITGNLTVAGQTRAGYLSITPDPDSTPSTSTLNFPVGDTRANGVSVPLNATGDLSIVYKASGGTTHVILDVTGYYLEDPAGLLFYPLTPGRVMDTRTTLLSGLSGPFSSSTPRRLDVAGHWGAPLNAEAVTGNLTVVGQTAAGYVSATLNSEVSPTTSVLNFPLGDIRANGVTLPLNPTGRSWFVYKASPGKLTHLILDLSGYFN